MVVIEALVFLIALVLAWFSTTTIRESIGQSPFLFLRLLTMAPDPIPFSFIDTVGLVAPVIASTRQAIWLLPTATFRDFALTRRGWTTIEGTSDSERARANRFARDDLLTGHVRRTAAELGLTTIEIDGSRGLSEITAAVEGHFAPLLASR